MSFPKELTDQLPETISFHANGYLENAGIVGLANVLGPDNYQLDEENDTIIVKTNDIIHGFSKKYFTHLINRYGKYSNYFTQIVNYKDKLENLNLDKLTKDDVRSFADFTINRLDSFLHRNTIQHGLKNINDEVLEKFIIHKITEIKDGKKKTKTLSNKTIKRIRKELNPFIHDLNFYDQKPEDAIDRVKTEIPEILELLNHLAIKENADKILISYLPFIILNNFWSNTSILGTSKTDNFIQEYEDDFIRPMFLQLINTKKGGNVCNNCQTRVQEKVDDIYAPKIEKEIEDKDTKEKKKIWVYPKVKLYKGASWVNTLGYDLKKKHSNAYNSTPVSDGLCAKCAFLYTLGAFGFNYNLFSKGIFINNNASLKQLIKTNNFVSESLNVAFNDSNTNIQPRKLLTDALIKARLTSNSHLSNNVQVIVYDVDHYETNIISDLSSQILGKIFENTEDNLITRLGSGRISNDSPSVNDVYLNDQVISMIMNHQDLTNFINKCIWLKTSENSNAKFTNYQLMQLILINALITKESYRYLKEEFPMENLLDPKKLKQTRNKGLALRKAFKQQGNENKVAHTKSKLNQGLHAHDVSHMSQVLIDAYYDVDGIVPVIFTETLGMPEIFEKHAQAFMEGLLEKPYEKDDNPENNPED